MENITEDSSLASAEKEFVVRVNKAEERIDIFSEIASINRHLLSRDDFTVERQRKVSGSVVAMWGTLPLGTLKIQKNERKHGSFSNIVAEH